MSLLGMEMLSLGPASELLVQKLHFKQDPQVSQMHILQFEAYCVQVF